MTEPRHDTQEMSTEEIREAIESMEADSTAPPSMVSEVILAAQFPDAVTCPDCGHIFVPATKLGDDETTVEESIEVPTKATR